MSIFKREGSPFWHYDFTVKGVRFRGSTETEDKRTAKNIEATLRSEAIEQGYLGKKPSITLSKAAGRLWLEYACHLKSKAAVDAHCQHLIAGLGKDILIENLTGDMISTYVAKSRLEKINPKSKKWRIVSPSTINRRLSTLRRIITMAKDNWGYATPDIKLSKYFLIEPEGRTNWLSYEEAEYLTMVAADHLKPIIRFALATGLRTKEILNLRWEKVSFQAMQMEFIVKSNNPQGKKHTLPITSPIMEILQGQKPKAKGYIFTYEGQKINKLRRSFKTACKNAGIEDFKFHDLRHTAATWMRRNGVPLDVVQEVLGHSDITTTKRYAHVEMDDKRNALEKLGAAQIRRSNPKQKGKRLVNAA